MSERRNSREGQNRNRQANDGNGKRTTQRNGSSQNPNNRQSQGRPYQDPYGNPYQNDPYYSQNYNPNGGGNRQNPNGGYNHPYQNNPQNGPYGNNYNPNGQGYYSQNPNGAYQDGYRGQGAPYPNMPQGDPRQDNGNKKKKRKGRRKVLFAVEIIILLVLALGLFAWAKLNKVNRTDIPEGNIILNSEMSQDQQKVLKGYQNIALYGVDSREGLTKDALSDTIMVASINKDTKDVKLVSVYRDTYLDNTNGEYRKATECYLMGGAERSINMLNKNLDLDITDYVTVNFNAVAEVVDALGGVEIDVTEDEIVHLNNYQVEGSQVTGKEIVPVTDTGVQTLNGLQALSYCRIRYTDGNDYKRTERQRTVLGEIMKKAKTTDLLKLNNTLDAILPNISTNLTNMELLGLLKDIAGYNIVDTTGFPFDLLAANIQAGDCVVPVNLANNVTQLHKYLFNINGYSPSATVQEISDKIINDTGIQ